MDIRDTKRAILSEMKHTLAVCKPSGDYTQWYIRCPYCGDSSNESHGHLSVKIDVDDDHEPMLYRCFKCEASGQVSQQFLQDIGINVTPDILNGIKIANKKAGRFNRFQNDYIPNYTIPMFEASDLNLLKLQYLKDRLGYDFTLEDMIRFKVVLDFERFLEFNHIDASHISPRYKHFLNVYYIGFLAANNNVVTMRCILPKEEMSKRKMFRYLKIELDPHNKNPNSYYSIPVSVPLLSEDPLNIHISEGIFDILGVYLNTKEDYMSLPGNHGFYASCSFGPTGIIQNLVYNGLGYCMKVHVYCDNDKTDRDVSTVFKRHPQILPWMDEIYYHRNGYHGEKDFGVPKKRTINRYRKVSKKEVAAYG